MPIKASQFRVVEVSKRATEGHLQFYNRMMGTKAGPLSATKGKSKTLDRGSSKLKTSTK